MDRIVAKLAYKAEAGDIQAIRELADRTDGKPAQEITADVSGTFEVVFKTVYESESDA